MSLSANETSTLKEVEAKLSTVQVTDLKSPASIVIFSSLYNISSPATVSSYPCTEKFFVSFLETGVAKHGIELAVAHTADQKVDTSMMLGASVPTVELGAQNLRPGIFAEKIHGKMY
jgi:hypothetical protein